MEVVITSLDALIHRATNASLDRPDPAALEAFCSVLGDSPNGAYIATRVIASRIRSPHPTEALLALDVLDACMKRCDVTFHAEVDKFRFLNEMIKLVSPKYYGNKTAPAVRQKVLNLMHSWTVDYPREVKIRDAFEMLKKQGVVKDVPPAAPPEEPARCPPRPRSKDAIFEDDERSRTLQKLLQSKNPEDLQAANRMIKTMVREDERRVEAVSRRISELQTVHNNARLLDEMLEQYRPGASSTEDLDLIKELHAACSRLRPTVFKLAAETQQNEEMLNEVLEASDELGQVFDKYNSIILQGKSLQSLQSAAKNKPQPGSILLNGEGNSLVDLAVSGHPSNKLPSTSSEGSGMMSSNLEDLGDIFSSVGVSKDDYKMSQVDDAPILTPISLISSTSDKDSVFNQRVTDVQPISRGLAELDALGEDLLKQSLPPSCKVGIQFNSKHTEKVPMNLLTKASLSPIENINADSKQQSSTSESHIPKSPPSSLLDLDFLISKTLKSEGKCHPQACNDDVMVDISSDDALIEARAKPNDDDLDMSLIEYLEVIKMKENDVDANSSVAKNKTENIVSKSPNDTVESKTSTTVVNTESKVNNESGISPVKASEVKPLTDINISLGSIKPGSRPPMTVFEETDGVAVVLHFAENRPRPDVSVIVISTSSRNSQPIEEFKFHAVVPKGCKVRLLPPSGDGFPAFSPFLPPAAITQVMLIARPAADPPVNVFLKFVITYTCQDDSISEMGEVSNLPLNDL